MPHFADYAGSAIASGSILTGSTGSQQLVARDDARLSVIIFNHTVGSLFVKLGNGASPTNFTVKVASGSYWEHKAPVHTGSITAQGDAAGGFIMTTQLFKPESR